MYTLIGYCPECGASIYCELPYEESLSDNAEMDHEEYMDRLGWVGNLRY